MSHVPESPTSANPPVNAAAQQNARPASRRMRWILPLIPIALALVAALVIRPLRNEPVKNDRAAVGTMAPDFSLRDLQRSDNERPVKLSELVQRGPVVLIFHRGLNCPVCTRHLAEIGDHSSRFKESGIQVVAIGPDDFEAARMYLFDPIPFMLLSDPGDQAARAFGLESSDGLLLDGAFVIDGQRRIQLALKANEPVGEPAELLSAGKAALSPR